MNRQDAIRQLKALGETLVRVEADEEDANAASGSSDFEDRQFVQETKPNLRELCERMRKLADEIDAG